MFAGHMCRLITAAALTITAKREQTLDFTHPFHTSGLGIAVSSKNKAGWFTVMERFLSFAFLKVLIALAMVLFIAGLLVWFFEHKHNVGEFGAKLPRCLGAGFWWSAVTMTTVGYGDKSPKTLGGELDAMVYDAPVLRYLVSNELNGTLQVLPKTFERQYYAIGLPQGSELRERINRVLAQRISRRNGKAFSRSILESHKGLPEVLYHLDSVL